MHTVASGPPAGWDPSEVGRRKGKEQCGNPRKPLLPSALALIPMGSPQLGVKCANKIILPTIKPSATAACPTAVP